LRQSSHSAAEVAQAMASVSSFLFLLHEFPDGDSVGCGLAMKMALARLAKQAVVASPTPPPDRFSFLPGFGDILPLTGLPQPIEAYDCVFFLDCSDPRRAGLSEESLARCDLVINVDHHPSNTYFGRLNYVEERGSAAAEQVRLIVGELGVQLDRDMAVCLYVAVSTDTGGFRFDNTTAGTHRLAAELLELGVEPGPVGEIINDTRTLSSLRLLQRMLGTLSFAVEGRIAWVTVTRAMLAECGATDAEVEGLVGYPRMIDSVDLCFLLQEMPGGLIRVAFRSKHDFDVGAIAESLGGGGHRKAAGCLLLGDLGQVLTRVLTTSKRALEGVEGSS
jgi:phosphoesterase RecJ-like protein